MVWKKTAQSSYINYIFVCFFKPFINDSAEIEKHAFVYTKRKKNCKFRVCPICEAESIHFVMMQINEQFFSYKTTKKKLFISKY